MAIAYPVDSAESLHPLLARRADANPDLYDLLTYPARWPSP